MEGNSINVSKWAETVQTVLNVRPKTLYNYKRLYAKHIDPTIDQSDLDSVDIVALQRKLIELPAQTSRRTLMVPRVIQREVVRYSKTKSNTMAILKAPTIQITQKKFLTWEEQMRETGVDTTVKSDFSIARTSL